VKKLNPSKREVTTIIDACISNLRDRTLASRINSSKESIKEKETEYRNKATASELYKIGQHDSVGKLVTKDEMMKLYDNKFVKEGQPGRLYYNEIINLAPLNLCPYCLQRTVTTLDHYLPKSLYPAFAITPINLVPSCKDCNTAKLVESPICKNEESLHPYFDDVNNKQWLFAKIVRTNPVSFEFYVNSPEEWGDILKTKINNHFKNFSLGELYGIHAASELMNVQPTLQELYEFAGTEEVEKHLCLLIRGRFKNNKNSWQTAMYQAMAVDSWFHSHGF
jgi:hypothetical protein